MANPLYEQMERRAALHRFIRSRLPAETHRNATVCAVLDLHLRKEQPSVEECLFDMVRELCKANADMAQQLLRAMELAPPPPLIVLGKHGKGEKNAR